MISVQQLCTPTKSYLVVQEGLGVPLEVVLTWMGRQTEWAVQEVQRVEERLTKFDSVYTLIETDMAHLEVLEEAPYSCSAAP